MSITNKDSLRDYIHGIHDYLRNNGAGYGMNALKIFNIFYGLLKIEENDELFKKLIIPVKGIDYEKINTIFEFSKLDQQYKDNFIKLFEDSDIENHEDYEILMEGFRKVYRFTNLLEYQKPDHQNDERLLEIINGPILDRLADGNLRNFLFYEIPPLRNEVYCGLVKKIAVLRKQDETNNINDTHFQLNGKIYEYFVGRDKSAISEMGAYFTDRYIVNYIYQNLLEPVLNDNGTVKTMIDMFGGSGGFTLGYTEYLMNKYETIDWTTNINSIYHHDMNEDVVKSASLEMMCLTGIIPEDNFMKDNSFNSEFNKKHYDYIVTNPPYGGDKNNKSEEKLKRDKIKKYIKESLKENSLSPEIIQKRKNQLKDITLEEKKENDEWEKTKVTLSSCSLRVREFCKKYNLNPNDKEACSYIMLMEMLAPNGTAIGVLKEGVFFDKKYRSIVKVLIENYNVEKVISIDSKAFENTTTKTSIIVFHNTEEKTSKIDFFNLVVNKEEDDVFEEDENGYITLSKNKGDIIEVTDMQTASASIEKIRNKNYSLNFKVYEKSKIKCNEGYHFEKLKDICELKRGNPLNKDKDFFKDKLNNDLYPVYGSGDLIGYSKNFNMESNTCILVRVGGPKSKNCSKYLLNNFYLTDASFSLYKYKKDFLKKYTDFYFLSNYDEIFRKTAGGTCQYTINQKTLYDLNIPIPDDPQRIEYWSNIIGEQFDLINLSQKEIDDIEKKIIGEIQRICDYEDCCEKSIDKLCDINPENIKTNNDYEYINYIDISLVEKGNLLGKKYIKKNNKFPSRAKRITNKNDILYSTVRPNLLGYTLIKENIDNCISSTGFCLLRNKSEISIYYLYYSLISEKNTDILISKAKGTTYPSISNNDIESLKIFLPKNTQLINNLQPDFDRLEELHEINKNAKTSFDTLISELRNEAITECEDDSIEDASDEDEENDLDNEDESVKSVSTTSSKSTKTNKPDLEEILYSPVKATVETFAEIKKRLNNGNDIKIKCPCNNGIICQSNHWDQHRKTDIHKDYVKLCFPVDKKKSKK